MSAAVEQSTQLDALSALKAQKQKLALAVVAGGGKKVRAELTDIVQQIAALEFEIELAELADQERRRIDAQAEEQRRAADLLAKQEELKSLRATAAEKHSAFKAALLKIVEPLGEVREAERKVYQVAMDLGLNPHWNCAAKLKTLIDWELGSRFPWLGLDYVHPSHRPGGVVMREEEWVLCDKCGSSTARSATHNCSIIVCDRCGASYDKHLSHRCDVNAVIEKREGAPSSAASTAVAGGPANAERPIPAKGDTHSVLKPFEAAGERSFKLGEFVDASTWRNSDALVSSGYLAPIGSPAAPAVELAESKR